jgi:hypothetical protein
MYPYHAVIDLAAVAVVLSTRAHSFAAALRDAGLVDAPDGLGMRVFAGHDLLTAVSQFLFIPLD